MRSFLLVLLTGTAVLAQSPQYQGVASSKHIMNGMQKPAMDSLAAMNKAGGPKTDEEWELAGQHAAVLAETAQLLLMGNRPKDQDVWVKSSNRLLAASNDSFKAAEGKNLDAWKASIGQIGGSCRSCHNVHRPKKGQPGGPGGPPAGAPPAGTPPQAD